MIKPYSIKPGDKVAIVAPASASSPEKLESGIKLLVNRGYQLSISKTCYQKEDDSHWTDEEKATDLIKAWNEPEIKAIICSRGGYGSARLFPFLNFRHLVTKPKLFVGFSDITTLHIALNNCGLATLHAPMLLSLSVERESWVVNQWFNAMEGNEPIKVSSPNAKCVTIGKADGIVTGGCLCLICDSLGTSFEINTKDRLLLIEDVDEPPHRVDAMLTHLINAGKLQESAGIILGEMTRTNEKRDEGIPGLSWEEIVLERIKPLGIPAIMKFPFGHANEMASLPLGIKATLDADNCSLEYLELGVLNT